VDVRIGVSNTPREIEMELADGTDVTALTTEIDEALAKEGAVLWLTDRRGRRIGVPSAKVAYVEIGSPAEDRRVGFGSGVIS